jgi:hypothetical protein
MFVLWYWGLNSRPHVLHLNHSASPLCFSYFQIRFCIPPPTHGTDLNQGSSTYASCVLGWQVHSTMPSFFVEMGILLTFLPSLASNLDPPDLCLPSCWNYRYASLHLASHKFLCILIFILLPCFPFRFLI